MDPQYNHNQQQPQDQQNQPVGLYSTNPASKVGIRFNLKKVLAWGSFSLVVLGIIGATFWGVNELFVVAETERSKLAAAMEANEALPEQEQVYFGDGSDIVEVTETEEKTVCPTGYTQQGDICVKMEAETTDVTDTGGCPNGYIKDIESSGSCVRFIDGTVDVQTVAAIATYSCPNGFDKRGSGGSTTCVRVNGGRVDSKPATKTTVCDSGYNASGDSCTKNETVAMIAAYSCASGQSVSGKDAATKCTKTTTTNGTVRASCPSGYWAQGSGVKTICYYTKTPGTTTTKSCPQGGTLNSAKTACTYRDEKSAVATTIKTPICHNGSHGRTYALVKVAGVYVCVRDRDGTKERPTCRGDEDHTVYNKVPKCQVSSWEKSSVTYKCPAGYTGGVSMYLCVKNVSYTPSSSTSKNCDAYPGLKLNSSKTECYKTGTVTLKCDSGFARSGSGSNTKCTKITVTNHSPIVTKSCPSSYSQRGDSCERTVSKPGEPKYSCSGDFALSGTNCVKTIGGTETKANPSVAYACPRDYKAEGSGSGMKCTKTVTTAKVKQSVCENGWVKRQSGDKFDCVLVRS